MISLLYCSRFELMAFIMNLKCDMNSNNKNYMNIKHIPIPFDQLELFKDEEKYQNYIIQTLIYSTKVNIHRNNSKNKYIFVVTKRNILGEEDGKSKNKIAIPLSSILEIVKSQEHPELVLSTEQNYDNLRISASNEDRCQHIISSIAFYFTYLSPVKKTLKIYTIKQNSLLYFERTSKEKRSGPKLNLERYPCQEISYVQSKDSPDIVGKLVIQKMQLTKLINSQNSHLVHVAKVNESEEYVCHTIDKDQSLINALKCHKNVDYICNLLYARALEYKVQIFFEEMISLKPKELNLVNLFEQTYRLYDQVISFDRNLYISPSMLLHASKDSQKLILQQIRYKQLRFDDDYHRFLYKKIMVQTRPQDGFINKMYNLGMLLYHFLFGRPLFEHQDIQVSIFLKENTIKIPFPLHLQVSCSSKLRSFIQLCIAGHFHNKEMLLDHPWIREHQIDI